jgi:signal peptide peptidase SppA
MTMKTTIREGTTLKILDVLTSPWAILPEKLAEIQAIYSVHLRGEKIDIKGIEAQIGKPLNNEQKPYQVIDNVAIIELNGIMAKRMNLLMQISGGFSSQIAMRDFKQAFADPEVSAVILAVDSPGGTVDGTEELANAVFEARQQDTKPVITYADGLMASAAYWIGAASDRIYINGETAQIGSIGVVATHVDYSQWEAKEGIKTTEIFAGKYKRINSEYEPLSKEGKQYMQDTVDYFYSIFANTMTRYRPGKLAITEDGALPWADGKVFIGQQAIENGLVDGVKSLDELIMQLSQEGKTMLMQEKIKEDMERRLQNGSNG